MIKFWSLSFQLVFISFTYHGYLKSYSHLESLAFFWNTLYNGTVPFIEQTFWQYEKKNLKIFFSEICFFFLKNHPKPIVVFFALIPNENWKADSETPSSVSRVPPYSQLELHRDRSESVLSQYISYTIDNDIIYKQLKIELQVERRIYHVYHI